ncbi:AraC family transcriptional regulator [Caballeronia udeis]|uniref:AraC family transcriptional regulator n=1 Tax=Caballeronia udeis TaxID=1232866 RepID=A0A158GMG5_9BURK|nr:AraC family transcriptional regulator [Caballeronia udeis]SAL33304.1 AraC family transcriptional regulator [Caballeronia udeis]
MSADPFSDILKLVNAETVVSGGFTAGGAWAIRFPAPDKIKFSVVVKGTCWVIMDGEEEPVRAETGDVFLLSAQRSFVLASDLTTPAVDAHALFSGNLSKIAKLGAGEDFIQIGGHVRLDPTNGGLLAEVLPPFIHIRAGAPQATALRWILDQLVREREEGLPGAHIASSQLAQLMFVQILRVHLKAAGPLAAGWLRVAGDQRLAPALRLMHGDPGRSWQLEELARAVAMSRTTFASHFKAAAGVAPLTYLTQWRMHLAERALREEGIAVVALARSLGYTSESAFSNAFKRATGKAPKHYRSAARRAASRGGPQDQGGASLDLLEPAELAQ